MIFRIVSEICLVHLINALYEAGNSAMGYIDSTNEEGSYSYVDSRIVPGNGLQSTLVRQWLDTIDKSVDSVRLLDRLSPIISRLRSMSEKVDKPVLAKERKVYNRRYSGRGNMFS